jgi:hypothetical protein
MVAAQAGSMPALRDACRAAMARGRRWPPVARAAAARARTRRPIEAGVEVLLVGRCHMLLVPRVPGTSNLYQQKGPLLVHTGRSGSQKD